MQQPTKKLETPAYDGVLGKDDKRFLAAAFAMAGFLAEGKSTFSTIAAKSVQIANELLEKFE